MQNLSVHVRAGVFIVPCALSPFPSCRSCLRWCFMLSMLPCDYAKENAMERGSLHGLWSPHESIMFPLITHCPLCYGTTHHLVGFKIPILVFQFTRAPERRGQDPLGFLLCLQRAYFLPEGYNLVILWMSQTSFGCSSWMFTSGSSESLHNFLGIIKMQTIPRLHNSTCKRVSGWPWLFIEKPIKSPHLGSWTEYRFEDNILGPYGNQHHFACMLHLHFHLWSTSLHPSLPHPEIIVICKNMDVYS